MDDEDYSYQALQEPLYRYTTTGAEATATAGLEAKFKTELFVSGSPGAPIQVYYHRSRSHSNSRARGKI